MAAASRSANATTRPASDGVAGDGECLGTIVDVVRVRPGQGTFNARINGSGLTAGDTVCVQSIIGAYQEVVVQ